MHGFLFYGGSILTLEEPFYAEALLIQNGRIEKVGAFAEVKNQMAEGIKEINLHGKALMPSFIDPHSHITAYAATLGLVDLETAKSFQNIIQKIKAFQRERKIQPGQWILGFGYDHNFLKEKAHPNRHILDQASSENPILLSHASGHMGSLNTMALKALGIQANTPDPEGGKIGREKQGGEPSGYLEETAFTENSANIPRPSLETALKQLELAELEYLKNGITTIQDGYTKKGEWNVLKEMSERNRFKADIVCYIGLKESKNIADENLGYVQKYKNRLKIGGYKIFLDGSSQGRTAWMTEPYEKNQNGYCGYGTYRDTEVIDFAETALQENMQLLAHCNGDAAADQLIKSYQAACQKQGSDKNIRPVMIHAQLVRRDQLKAMAACSMIASFFVAHTYFWGDIHIENFGVKRAQKISPVHSAIENGVVYTLHQDSPVIKPDMLFTIWCAVNRISRTGADMGKEEGITPLEAVLAVTKNAAYQYFEEDEKGTLKEGKLADLVVLDRNILEAPAWEIKDIKVLATIKEGKLVYGSLEEE